MTSSRATNAADQPIPGSNPRAISTVGAIRSISSRVGLFILAEAEGAGLCGVEKRTRPDGVLPGDEDLDGPEAVERQSVRVSQRLTTLDGGNPRGFEERADLLRVNGTTGDEDALQVRIHMVT